MKKSTEKKRIVRMQKDARQLFMKGLISTKSLDSFQRILKESLRRL